MIARWKCVFLAVAMVLSAPIAPIDRNTAAAQSPYQGAYQTGYDAGYPEGYRAGYHDGSEGRAHHYHPPDGYNPYTRGIHDGRHEGYTDGYRDGRNGANPRY